MAPFEALYGGRCRTPLNRSEPGERVTFGPDLVTRARRAIAYRLELPPHLAAVHDVFHVSQLKKCLRVPEEVIDTSQIQIQPDLTYEEKPIKILDQKQRSTRRRTINFYKVQWSNHSEEEATWEQEEFLRAKYPAD
ncbi:hypothetical protein U9M48_043327 [Paspalum notatum var. saurae]|uniref:Chromo domain-containing protein n=1 Tax=Paspalum notatum var. saurae TaxID=547442 RepID=A0AAQ3UT97_PASNO